MPSSEMALTVALTLMRSPLGLAGVLVMVSASAQVAPTVMPFSRIASSRLLIASSLRCAVLSRWATFSSYSARRSASVSGWRESGNVRHKTSVSPLPIEASAAYCVGSWRPKRWRSISMRRHWPAASVATSACSRRKSWLWYNCAPSPIWMVTGAGSLCCCPNISGVAASRRARENGTSSPGAPRASSASCSAMAALRRSMRCARFLRTTPRAFLCWVSRSARSSLACAMSRSRANCSSLCERPASPSTGRLFRSPSCPADPDPARPSWSVARALSPPARPEMATLRSFSIRS